MNNSRLSQAYGEENYRVNYGKLPTVIAEQVREQLGTAEVDIVRTYLFCSYAENHHPQDEDLVKRRLDFFDMLTEEYNYEVEMFPVDFRGRRVRKEDRNPRDSFEPREKCVDIALATSMLYFAALPYVYDVAIAVVGDADFLPALQYVRRLGKRVAIVSIKGSCASELSDLNDEARVRDFDVIWLDDLLSELEMRAERRQLACQSSLHKGDKKVWTDIRLRKGRDFICPDCRRLERRQPQTVSQQIITKEILPITQRISEIGQVILMVRPFLRRFRRNGAQPGIER